MADTTEVYGPLRHEGEVEAAVVAKLELWLEHYLDVVAERFGHEKIKPPLSYEIVSEYVRYPEEGLPAILVTCPGVKQEPERDGAGVWDARYNVTVLAEVSGPDTQSTRLLGQLYATAIHGALMHNRSLGPGIAVVGWGGSNNGLLDTDERRKRIAYELFFTVMMRDVVSDMAGPRATEPPSPTPTELPEVTSVDVTATHMAEES